MDQTGTETQIINNGNIINVKNLKEAYREKKGLPSILLTLIDTTASANDANGTPLNNTESVDVNHKYKCYSSFTVVDSGGTETLISNNGEIKTVWHLKEAYEKPVGILSSRQTLLDTTASAEDASETPLNNTDSVDVMNTYLCVVSEPTELTTLIDLKNKSEKLNKAWPVITELEKALVDNNNDEESVFKDNPNPYETLVKSQHLAVDEDNKIVSLFLANIEVIQLPDLSALTNLQRLDVSENQLTELPDLSALTNLQRLDVSHNQLTHLPDLSELKNLKRLAVNNNQLTHLPDLSALKNLASLDVSYNQLTHLPDLSKLTKLTGLYVSDNQLKKLPDLNTLTKLQFLNYANNQNLTIQSDELPPLNAQSPLEITNHMD